MKRLRVPYFRQQRDHWCGPAVLQMVLETSGIRKTQAALARAARTTKRSGTSWVMLRNVLRAYGLPASAKRGTPDLLRRSVHSGNLVIVNFVEPSGEEGHFAIVTGMDADDLVLNDPWNGKGFRMALKDFSARWARRSRRMLVLKRKPGT